MPFFVYEVPWHRPSVAWFHGLCLLSWVESLHPYQAQLQFSMVSDLVLGGGGQGEAKQVSSLGEDVALHTRVVHIGCQVFVLVTSPAHFNLDTITVHSGKG